MAAQEETPEVADLEPRFKNYSLRGRAYVLREASEGAAVAYRNATIRGMRMEDGKIVGMTGVADAEPTLVAACLFEVGAGPDGGDKLAGRAFVDSLPSRVVKPMFEWVKTNSDLGEGDPDPKAPPTGTTPTSD